MQEIRDQVDQHSLNAERFNLPERVIAKIFVFRLIYGGSKWSYCLDPDFNWISKSPEYWQKVIDEFYDKYKGIAVQHTAWVREAVANQRLVMPTGRWYPITPYMKKGQMQWPRTKILNYPVQGLGHDLMQIARVSFKRRLDVLPTDVRTRIKLVSTVHDSIVVDCDESLVTEVGKLVVAVFNDIPANFERLFGHSFNLPMTVEMQVGPNLFDMTTLTINKPVI